MEKDTKSYNSDITKDDLQALGERTKNIRTDGGDDKLLKNRTKDVDFAGKDLDVPGRKSPNATKKSSIKDEENQLYSQGGSGRKEGKR